MSFRAFAFFVLLGAVACSKLVVNPGNPDGSFLGTGGGNTIAGGHEDCANTVDDDNDGVTDCADPDCFGKATCCIDICT
ncbi:MAG: hypothetical protein K1X64_23770, partial [Myxococcaceae bacterium]|nr:hypothetical protein [Myxococcaceae bacterium]